jgi:hypothetical protein
VFYKYIIRRRQAGNFADSTTNETCSLVWLGTNIVDALQGWTFSCR